MVIRSAKQPVVNQRTIGANELFHTREHERQTNTTMSSNHETKVSASALIKPNNSKAMKIIQMT